MQRVSGCVCIYMDSHELMKFLVFDGIISEVAARLLTSVNNLLKYLEFTFNVPGEKYTWCSW